MEVIKKRILLEKLRSRSYDSTWGTITATSINILFEINQSIKDLGAYQPYDYIKKGEINPETGKLVDYTSLIKKLGDNAEFEFIKNPNAMFVADKVPYNYDTRYNNKNLSDYYQQGFSISGNTDDKLESFSSYGFTGDSKYKIGKVIEVDLFENYTGKTFTASSLVLSNNNFNPITYVHMGDLNDDRLSETTPPYLNDGILYETFNSTLRTVKNEFGTEEIPLTKFYFKGQGLNKSNLNMSALTRDEYLLYITEEPKVESDVFIERGGTVIFAKHGRMAEINNLSQLEKYGNGFYKINKV